jgi:hypothetical protein
VSAHLEPPADVDKVLTKELFFEWLQHPVTKVIGLVIVAEIVYQFTLRRGARLLGLEEAGE